jgi:AcrR family transcriptional regulator
MAEFETSAVPRRFTDRSADTRAAILAAARSRFASDGYDKTTIRAVAADAGIDPSMVMRYYGSKANLFQASAAIALPIVGQLPGAVAPGDNATSGDSAESARPDQAQHPQAAISAEELAEWYAQMFIGHWEKGDKEVERMVLRTAMTHPEAVAQVQRLFDEQVAPPVLAVLGEDPDARLRAALVHSQALGIVLCRYLYGLDPIASADPQVLEDAVRDVIALHLTRPLSRG